MAFARTALLGAAVALSAGGMMATSASAAPVDAPREGHASVGPDRAKTSDEVRASTVTKHVWRDAPSYEVNGKSLNRVGTLSAGDNYFYCQTKGPTRTVGEHKNDWWLYTDDDSGNTGVWVNAVNISGGANFERIAGVPMCTK